MSQRPEQSRSLVWLAVGEEGGGLAVALVNLAAECAQRGHRVTIIAIAEGPLVDLARRRGLTVVLLGLPKPRNFAGNIAVKLARLIESRAYLKRHAPAIAAAIRAVDGETLHVLSPSLLRLTCRAAKLAGARPIWEMPNAMSDRVPFQLNRRLYRRVIRRNRVLVLADSEYTAATIRGDGVEPIVFYHAVDASRFDPDRAHKWDHTGHPDLGARIGIIARLVPDKGQAETVEALAILGDPNLSLTLIGGPLDSAFANKLQKRVVELGLQAQVRLAGAIEDPENQLGAFDFTISARTVEEPFGISIVEAQLMRKPVLVRAWGGPAEIVVDGQTGWHLRQEEQLKPATIAEGIQRALADRKHWPEMGRAARERSLKKFAAEKLADRYVALLG